MEPHNLQVNIKKLFVKWLDDRKTVSVNREQSQLSQGKLSDDYIHSLRSQTQRFYQAFSQVNKRSTVFNEGLKMCTTSHSNLHDSLTDQENKMLTMAALFQND